MKARIVTLGILAALLAVIGTAGAAKPKGKLVRLGDTEFGTALVDRRRRALYLFTRDRRKKSRCYGECARVWPPLITKGRPRAGRGLDQDLLGTTRRRSGKRQVTYRGRPLYYYVGDDAPLEVRCQAVPEFGGTWFIVDKRGRALR